MNRISARREVGVYRLCGLTMVVETADSAAEQTVAELLAGFPVMPLSTLTEPADLVLSVTWVDTATPFPTSSHGYSCFGVTLSEEGDRCIVADEDAAFEFDRDTCVGKLQLRPSFMDQGTLRKHNLFLLGLMQGLLAHGFFDLHAAGVVRGGVAYLLVGEPASGKSSAALSLACQGWGYLSDDALLLRRSASAVQAFGFRRKFCIDPRLANYWPAIAEQLNCATGANQSKQFVDLEKALPGQLYESVQPRVLIFTRIVDEPESRLSALDQTSALVRLLDQSASLSFNRDSAAKHLALLRDLVNQTISYELCAGRDLYHEPGKVAELLESIEDVPGRERIPSSLAGSQAATQRSP